MLQRSQECAQHIKKAPCIKVRNHVCVTRGIARFCLIRLDLLAKIVVAVNVRMSLRIMVLDRNNKLLIYLGSAFERDFYDRMMNS